MIRHIAVFCGIDVHKHSDDRYVLETTIFPYFVERSGFSKILFVGCSWYTRGYKKIFKDKDYWTIDIDKGKKKYGAKNHIVDSLENVVHHFRDGELDLIVCNGVLGFGLNNKANAESAFRGCFKCLSKGGVFLLGWNDIPKRRPFSLEECQSLKMFKPYHFLPLSTSQHLTSTKRHTYNFYFKE